MSDDCKLKQCQPMAKSELRVKKVATVKPLLKDTSEISTLCLIRTLD